ncbi:MAG: hypothetical protein HYX27_05130 [Acidobacteria bacterium]|nr:hypothetical protein [Acidobacteriota bacterium]
MNILVWDAPVYERFFAAVREVNRHLPKGRRIRTLLGDPAFDWDEIAANEQWKMAAQRDTHAADVVVREVLQKRRKALLFYGSSHVTRENAYLAFGEKPRPPNVTETLERAHAQRVFVIWPEMNGWGGIDKSYRRLAGWRVPSIGLVKDTWLGEQILGSRGKVPALEDLADAFLYLGPVRSLRQSVPPAKLYWDALYMAELERNVFPSPGNSEHSMHAASSSRRLSQQPRLVDGRRLSSSPPSRASGSPFLLHIMALF